VCASVVERIGVPCQHRFDVPQVQEGGGKIVHRPFSVDVHRDFDQRRGAARTIPIGIATVSNRVGRKIVDGKVASGAMGPSLENRSHFYQRVDETFGVLLALVAEGIGWATTALLHQDFDAAHRVIEGDKVFDARCDQFTELVRQRLAGSTVQADEVETLATILQIIPELERSADLAEHIAQRSLQGLGGVISPLSRGLVQSISEATIDMWQELADAYSTRSREAAFTLDEADGELDELCASLVGEGTRDPENPQVAVDLALIARFYERLGDHAVNLARRIDILAAPRRLSPIESLAEIPPLRASAQRFGRWRLLSRLRRLRLAPRDDRYFDLFQEAATNASDCADHLRKLVVAGGTDTDHFSQVKACERRGDDITSQLLRLLDSSFVTPYDREDIHALVEELDDVVDDMFGAASMLQLVSVETALPEMPELADLLVTMSDELVALVACIRSGEGARYRLERIEQLEHHGDALYRKAIQRLFGGDYEAIEILKWKDIVQGFEAAANAIENVSDVVESILIKEN
jgi:predicted phosphate transport protein (TIGR00153 family)